MDLPWAARHAARPNPLLSRPSLKTAIVFALLAPVANCVICFLITRISMSYLISDRRQFIRNISFVSALFTVPGAFAEELTRTTEVEEGPYYPTSLPLDTDNDLLIINDSITPAVGRVTHLSGRLLDTHGDPIRNALLEIWQVDSTGTYLRARSNGRKYDANFQGFGRFMTGSTGEYYFRTIQPIPYELRPAPHIHFAVKLKGRDKWTTQLFVRNHPGNLQDRLYRGLGSDRARSVTVDFTPVPGSRVGELAAHFDIVLGMTPEA